VPLRQGSLSKGWHARPHGRAPIYGGKVSTRAGMKAALELGRWVFLAPIGYLNTPRRLRRAIEAYATGHNRRAAAEPALPGIVDVIEYGVRGKRGDFEPVISEYVSFRVQAVLSGDFRVPRRNSGRTRTSYCAASCGASSAGGDSLATGQRTEASTTVLPLLAWLSRGERHEGEAGGTVRRRTGAAARAAGYMRLRKEYVLQNWNARTLRVSELRSTEVGLVDRSNCTSFQLTGNQNRK
jgi:hypothetical protein